MQRRIAIAAGAALPAAIAAGSEASECKAPSPMSSSFEFISESEIEDVSREIDLASKDFVQPTAQGSLSLSGSHDLQDLGNGWVAPAADEATTRSVLALGKSLAQDPRVQAAILDRVRDLPSLTDSQNSSQKLLEELKLVLVKREMKADGTTTTTETSPCISRTSSADELEDEAAGPHELALADGAAVGDEAKSPETEEAKPPQVTGEAEPMIKEGKPKGGKARNSSKPKGGAKSKGPAQKESKGAQAEEDEPSLAAALLEAALVVASVIVITVVAKRVNPRACALAAAALAGAWTALMAPFGGKRRSRADAKK